MRYRLQSRESHPGRDYHVDTYEILDNRNNPIIQDKQPLIVQRSVPKRIGKTKKNSRGR